MDWFNGNLDAQDLYEKIVFVAHLWDDLIDGDPRSAEDINLAFLYCFVHIPANKIFREYSAQLTPMFHAAIMGYMSANTMEKSGDDHKLEIAHGLRYAIGQVIVFIVLLTNPHDRALAILPDLWKKMMPERWEDYRKEHRDVTEKLD